MTKSKKIMIGALPFAALIVLFAVFCGIVSSKGYRLDTSKLTGTDLWIINYRAESLGSGYQGKGNVVMWRYTNQGTVNGVNGKVNISIRYKTY